MGGVVDTKRRLSEKAASFFYNFLVAVRYSPFIDI